MLSESKIFATELYSRSYLEDKMNYGMMCRMSCDVVMWIVVLKIHIKYAKERSSVESSAPFCNGASV